MKKIWWFKIFDLTLHHFPLEKIGGQNEGMGFGSDPTKRKKLFFIAI